MDVRKVIIGLTLSLLLGNGAVVAISFDDLMPEGMKGKPFHSDILIPAGPYPSDPLLEWKPLAEQGDVTAQYNLGVIYENGVGTQRNYRTAVNWYTKAAEQDLQDAQYNLGYMYAHGKGVLENDKIALEWWTKAAERGDAEFQHRLAQIYRSGKDVEESHKAYVKWNTLAAKQGYSKAQRNKAYDYLNGRISDSLFGTLFGFNRDKLRAYMWMNLAIYNGSHFSQTDKKAFTYDMTQAQTSKAQDMSSRCLDSGYTDC
jgi:TPR repeat protein